ncbi:ABC transporter substrate-binding protein, partial [Micromonospora zhanjiangensis]
MKVSKRAVVFFSAVALVCVASGCSGGGSSDSGSTKDGAITIDGTQPEVGLVPSNTTETGGGNILDYM